MSARGAVGPVTPHDRVSDVLARDESLVEVFARRAPPFAKLRHRAMRRVMARLVTVEQAARMAGVSAAALVNDLNDALGYERQIDVPAAGDGANIERAEPSTARPIGAPEVELDVRAALRAGEEPFSRIMAAVAALAEGEVLHLRAIFEPVPLYGALAARGFTHETQRHASDDWSVWFWRGDAVASSKPRRTPAATTPEASERTEDAGEERVVWLDVRCFEPPEPLVRTLAALETLPADHTLIQINARVPRFLLPILAERGFAVSIDESQADRVLVRIRRDS